jgi:hypothetical protein
VLGLNEAKKKHVNGGSAPKEAWQSYRETVFDFCILFCFQMPADVDFHYFFWAITVKTPMIVLKKRKLLSKKTIHKRFISLQIWSFNPDNLIHIWRLFVIS